MQDFSASPTIPNITPLEPKVFGDDCGFFFESFSQAKFEIGTGERAVFVQDKCSRSVKKILRGLQNQIQQPQGKLVRVVQGVVQGEMFNVAVDLHKFSTAFDQLLGETLSIYNKTKFWAPKFKRNTAWNDATIGTQWSIQGVLNLSALDQQAKVFAEAENFK